MRTLTRMVVVLLGLAPLLCMPARSTVPAAFAKDMGAGEVGSLTPEELQTFKRIKRLYPDFVYTSEVRRHLSAVPETNSLVFDRDGLIDGQYVSYEVQFDPEVTVVNYWYDAGAAFNGWGTFLVTESAITRSDWACGTSGCGLQVQVDGKTVYESQ